MKAYRITSTEYQANQPDVFLFDEQNKKYYGELNYPRHYKFPTTIAFWRTATCADADRFFVIEEITIDQEDVEFMEKIRNSHYYSEHTIADYIKLL